MGPDNQYEAALRGVGSVLEPYDSDRSFPVFGFGGNYKKQGTSHCFPINGNPAAPEIFGIDNIVAMYKKSLRSIKLSGPTFFAPLLEQFLSYVRSLGNSPVYNIMFILTDGAILDMPRTKDLLVELSTLPVSVIIIGVGSEDFSAMEELDGDGGVLRGSNGQPCERDIVQFVEFKQARAQGNLSEQVLKEVPKQLCSHMERVSFQP